jgi:OOP family OmpA-OmpF porin
VLLAVGVILLSFAVAGNAPAQEMTGNFDVSPFIGLYVFEGNQNLDESVVYGVSLGYHFDENWGLEGVFGYIDAEADDDVKVTRGDREKPFTETVLRDPDHVDVMMYRLDGLYHCREWGDKLVPYLAAGIGALDINDNLIEDDGTHFLVNAGGGVKYFWTNSWAVRGDVRYIHTFNDSDDYNNAVATLGVTYLFGQDKGPCTDSDGDGVCDGDDDCPDTPAGIAVDENGCPQDSDMDGVPDYRDKCPGTPRGVRVDLDGCPVDSDGDGVPDYLDKCPGTPKGVAVDSDGCPRDSDGDGVPDYRDKCPNTPKGVVVDSDGCPIDSDGDGVPDYRDKCPGTPIGAPVNDVGCWVLKDVRFDFNKAEVKSQYFKKLDEAVVIMNKNPNMRVEIQGHTDSVGSQEYNQPLSEKRANAVMEYFVGQGVDPNRLTAVGFGLTKPVASNDTPEGRAKNRRVQLKPIY